MSQYTHQQVTDILKAAEARNVTGLQTLNQTGQSYAPLKIESLDAELKVLTPRMRNFVLYNTIPKQAVFNNIHQYDQQSRFGITDSFSMPEGFVPDVENNSEYIRRSVITKSYVELRRVTLDTINTQTIVGTGEATYRKEMENGMLAMARTLNQDMINGNSEVIPTKFDGLKALHASTDFWSTLDNYQESEFVIDLRDEPVSEDILNDAATQLFERGFANMYDVQMLATPRTYNDYVKQLDNTKYVNIGVVESQTGPTGQQPPAFLSSQGVIPFKTDVFIQRGATKLQSYTPPAATAGLVPNAPTTPTISAVADAETKFNNFDGDYFYLVTAVNNYGESAPLLMSGTALAVAGTESVDLTFTDGGGVNPATGYKIYRTLVNAPLTANTVFYPIFDVSVAQKAAGFDGGAAGVIRDRNRFISGTEDAWVLEWSRNVIEYVNLGQIGMQKVYLPNTRFIGEEFAVYERGAPLMYANTKVIKLQNIKVTR